LSFIPRGILKIRLTARCAVLALHLLSSVAGSGVSLWVIGKLLGHQSPQKTARYTHCHDHPLRTGNNSFDDLRQPRKPPKSA
jgi:hypothetical protein